MLNLKKLLDGLNVETENVVKKFSEIATELICNYQIESVSGERFNIYEIEFYFFNRNHLDSSVHRHNMKAGQWRVHYSGLDITFNGCTYMNDSCKNKKCIECKELASYGGILIRSIGNQKNPIVGPLKVQTTLLTGGSINSSEGISLIKTNNNHITKLITSTRCGVKNTNGFDNMNYCFFNSEILKEKDRSDGTKTRVAI